MSTETQSPSVIWSDCRRYRYFLRRAVSGVASRHGVCNFIMLNPSTADEFRNDPTVERCERRARQMGYGTLIVTNIFAWRSTDPAALLRLDDPVGPLNNSSIMISARKSDLVICAWGGHGKIRGRGAEVESMLRAGGIRLHYLKMSPSGYPWHPLYVGYREQPKLWF